jgi:hypothetical protein
LADAADATTSSTSAVAPRTSHRHTANNEFTPLGG